MSGEATTPERRQLAFQTTSGFAELSYLVYEPPSARRTVFCLHDFLGNSADFTRLARMMAAHGFRVVCPDLPGRGQSAYLAATDYNPQTYLAALLTLVQSFGNIRLSIIAKGWGGLLALGLAQAPGIAVSRLVLSDLGFPWTVKVDDAVRQAAEGPPLASLEEARRLLAESSEFKGVPLRHAATLIAGRLRQAEAEAGYRLDFDPVILSPEAIGKFGVVRTSPLFEGLKAKLLYLSSGKLRPKDRTRLQSVGGEGGNSMVVDNLARAEQVHFVTSHELLVTLGFMLSRYMPPV